MQLEDEVSHEVIAAAIEVHRHVGSGLLETTYEECLAREFSIRGLDYTRQYSLPVNYKGIELPYAYRLDLVVENMIVLELKAVEKLLPIHEAQLLTYLRLAEKKLGFLMNFNVPLMKHGIKRMVNGL